MNQILMVVMSFGVILGGLDHLFGNKLGYGKKFEEGFGLLGSMALSMAGMICLAPVLANVLGRFIIPLYQAAGVDPAMFGGILAIDMGGYQLAVELAMEEQIGRYVGIVVSAMFGCTLVFTIPVGMGLIRKEDQPYFARGIMLGLAAMPAGLLAGSIVSGLSLLTCLHQNLPIFLAAILLFFGLWKIPGKMVRGFCIFAGGIRVLVTASLILAAVESLCGFSLIHGMAPLADAMGVVSAIGIVLLGSLPVAELLCRLLKKPFARLGTKLNLNPKSLTGMLVSLVSPIPVFSMFQEMDGRGKVAAGAFLVNATSLLAAHLGFTLATAPAMVPALFAGKLVGAATALLLAMCFPAKNITN